MRTGLAVAAATVIGCALILTAGANWTTAERDRNMDRQCEVWRGWWPYSWYEHCRDRPTDFWQHDPEVETYFRRLGR
jgi:hypothetical protein